jgi:carboxyl-terminal processing protease
VKGQEEKLMNISSHFSGAQRRCLPIALAVGMGLIGGIAVDRFAAGMFVPDAQGPNFKLITQAWDVMDRVYVDREALKGRPLTYGAIDGMVNALGDTGHSRFLSPEMVKRLKQVELNNFVGIGAEVRMKDGYVVIVAPIQGSPAQKAGLQPGDIILKVDGSSVTGIPLDRVVAQITGRRGTKVTLTILNPRSNQTRDVTLVRSRIMLHEVTWRQLPGTTLAHLHIANFNKGVSGDLRKALAEIKKSELRGLILDVRNNPGGLLREAVASASQFLSGGNVLLVKNAEGGIKPIPVQSGGLATAIPMDVLVNGGTASASEIVAGALQDAERAKAVGDTTFGTGTVLSEFGLSDGSALLLAVEEWLTPKGHTIWHKGIVPNMIVSLPANAAPLFPESEGSLSAIQLRETTDKQLLRAMELLGQ